MKKYIIRVIIMTTLVYFLFAAYNWKINPGEWSTDCRFMWTMMTGMFGAFSLAFDHL